MYLEKSYKKINIFLKGMQNPDHRFRIIINDWRSLKNQGIHQKKSWGLDWNGEIDYEQHDILIWG